MTKILFAMLHPGPVRLYIETLKLLAERGHHIHLGFNSLQRPSRQKGVNEDLDLAGLCGEHPGITYSTMPVREDIWRQLTWSIRMMQDYLRYFNPIYENATKLKNRIESQIPAAIRIATRTLFGNGRRYNRVKTCIKLLKFLDSVIPGDKGINRFIRQVNPDVLLVSPLVDFGSGQADYIKSARNFGIKNALCVTSWDNLTNKGLIRCEPDNVIVWNEIQKDEAVTLHDIAPPRVVITGAQVFDDWFVRQPSTTCEEFCKLVGLDPANPFFLYLCSSTFVASNKEEIFVEEWIKRIRGSPDTRLKKAGILIRPHPLNIQRWQQADFSRYGNVSIYPRQGAVVINENSRAEFFDSLYHCKVTVGINTSALIEAGIVGRAVYTVLAPEFKDTQEGTLHFHYLTQGGLLRVSQDFEEHLEQLSAVLQENGQAEARLRSFIESFIRPHGIDLPCTPILADAIESLGKSNPAQPLPVPWWVHPVRILLLPLALGTLLAEKLFKKRPREDVPG